MSEQVQANTGEMDRLSKEFEISQQALSDLKESLKRMVNNTTWKSSGADDFRGTVEGDLSGAIVKIESAMSEMSQYVKTKAGQFEEAGRA